MKRKRHAKTRTTQLLTMDELHARPCEVDGRPALFHRWIEEDDVLLRVPLRLSVPQLEKVIGAYRTSRIVPDNCEITVAHHTFALVEYRDGTIDKVAPEHVRFIRKESRA